MFEYVKDSNLKLERFPLITDDKFLAWDAADEYIINQFNDNYHNQTNVIIIEDEFGAIGLSIQAEHIYYVNDSILSRKGILNNYQKNNIDTKNISFLSPYENFPEDIDLIILKIPKINHYFEFLLNKLNGIYGPNLPVIAGSMVKYLNPKIYELCKLYFSEFMYSLTWKKAKVISSKLTGISIDTDFSSIIKDFELTLINFPNLFSSKKIDIGTIFLIENLKNITLTNNIDNIIDVGAANGILGLSIFNKYPKANLWLTDISYSAYESASATIKVNNFNTAKINVIIENSLDYFNSDFANLIIINPPFHQNHKVTIETSLQIFEDCYRVLVKNGALIVVANKHLGYHKHLVSLFSRVDMINQNSKFVILLAIK